MSLDRFFTSAVVVQTFRLRQSFPKEWLELLLKLKKELRFTKRKIKELHPLLCPGHVGDKGQIKKNKSKLLEAAL